MSSTQTQSESKPVEAKAAEKTVVLDAATVVRAYIDTKMLIYLSDLSRSISSALDGRRIPSWYDNGFEAELASASSSALNAVGNSVRRIVETWVSYVYTANYLPGIYLLNTLYFPQQCIVPFIATPPQITHPETCKKYIHPSTYISHALLPVRFRDGKMHRSIVTKAFSAPMFLTLRNSRSKLFEAAPKLEKIFKNDVEKYGERRGRILGIKDIIRVYIGNAWLVWVYEAYQSNVIKSVVLPYHLAKNPELAVDMVDPVELLKPKSEIRSEVKNITWRWLVETAKKQ